MAFLRTVKNSFLLTRFLILPIIGTRTRTGPQKIITTPADYLKKDAINISDPLLSPRILINIDKITKRYFEDFYFLYIEVHLSYEHNVFTGVFSNKY